jgi:hypothetical protein
MPRTKAKVPTEMHASPLFRKSFCLLAFGWIVFIARAAHPLEEWTPHTVPLDNGSVYGLNSIAFGSGVFVAVGHRGKVLVSRDGANWTDTNPAVPVLFWRTVRFLNGQFHIVGATNVMLRSADGTNWAATLLPRDQILDVAYGNGRWVIADPSMLSSSNLVDWVPPNVSSNSFAFQTVVFSQNKFVASFVNYSTPSQCVTHSPDGINWTLAGSVPTSVTSPTHCIYDGGRYVLMHALSGQVFSSLDALTWQPSTGLPGDFYPLESVSFGANTFVVAGGGRTTGNFGFYTSSNAADWQLRFPNTATRSFTPAGMAYGAGRFVIVGSGMGNTNVYRSSTIYSPPKVEIKSLAGVKIFGVPGLNYRIEAAAGSDGPWDAVTNLILPMNPYLWVDYDSASLPKRLYRAVEAP